MKRLYLILFFQIIFSIYFSILNLYCQQKNLKFEHITTNEGLSQSSVNCILQDSKGFLWFGTRNGLNKYDGYSIATYFNNPKDNNSIAGNLIQSLFEDSQRNLWIGTDNGLSLYNRHIDNFINYNSQNNFKGSLIGNIYEDSQGRFWIGTIGKGLFLFDYKNNTFINYTRLDDNPNSLSSNEIRTLNEDIEGNLLIGTEGGGLNMFNYDSSTFKHLCYEEDPINQSKNYIWSLTKDHSGTIWIGTLGNGLYRLNIEPGNNYSFTNFKPETEDSRRFKILSLYADKNNGIWIGTENGGLDYFDINKETFKNYKYEEYIPNCLNNNSIQSIYIDNCGNLLVGTYTGGVNIVKKNKKKISLYSNVPGNPNSLSYNAVSCFYEDKNKNMWIGTDGGGLNVLDRQTDQITHYTSKNSNLNSDAVLSIASYKDNNILIGGWDLGLNIYNFENKSFKRYTQKNSNIPSNNIFDIMCDKKGRIWITFGGLGFARYDINKNEYKKYFTANIDLPTKWVHELSEDSYGNILLGTSEGLCIFNPENESIITLTYNSEDESSLSHNMVNAILESSDSVLWIGTNNGLNQFIRDTKSFVHYFEEDGLTNNNISGLVEDDNGYIWISTANGISKFDPKSKTFKNYNLSDGLQGKEFIRRSCYKTKNGEVVFGGTNGFNIFHPDSLQDNSFIPPVVITNFYLFFKAVSIGGEDEILQKHISETDQITLSYKHSMFSFEYAALDYTSPAKNQYAYMLEGFEKDWNYVGNRRIATYTNLDPGKYIFRVKASNSDGIWNEEGTFIKITVLPPWWETLLFRISVILFILTSAIGYYLYRVNSLKKQKVYLQKLVKERTMEIEEKNSILIKQANELNESNALLEERQQQIEEKNTILIKQANELNETNTILEERQQRIEEQAEELKVQKEDLEDANIHLNELNSTKDKFFSIIAHDLKNPFNTILGFSELLMTKFKKLTKEKQYKYSEVIYDSSKNIYNLLENLLQWARTQTDKIVFEPTVFNLRHLADQNITLLKENLLKKKITIEHENSDFYDVYADLNMINTVLRNLLTNAIKFTDAGGKISIDCLKKNSNVEVSIKDSGVGMSAEETKKLFRVDTNFSRKGTDGESGTGLGLILCKEFVKKNGGTIWVESNPGKGSTFIFTVPASDKF